MLRILLLTTALCAGIIAAGSASAAPMPAGKLDAAGATISSDALIPVHGYHRDCDRGWVPHRRGRDWHLQLTTLRRQASVSVTGARRCA
jgi:hypothetical protein